MQTPIGDQATTNLLPTASPFKCVEPYLSQDTVNDGEDYGVAISAAVKDSSLTQPTEVKICKPGDHPIYSPAILDRPIHLVMTGARLIIRPSNYFSNAPVSKAGVTATGGTATLALSDLDDLSVGMACGGVGIQPGSYIASLDVAEKTITLSLPSQLDFYAVAKAGSSILTGVSSLSGVTNNQSITGSGSKWPYSSGTVAISSVDYASNTITLAHVADNGSPIPDSFVITGNWTTNLTCVKQAPAIQWIWNPNALHNQYQQMIGASMQDVWIADTDKRSLSGAQGVQISGYDGFSSYNLRVDDLAGSAEILGGYITGSNIYLPVRESGFFQDQIRNSGDSKTGEPALSIFTPFENAQSNADEHNEIEFHDGHYVCSQGVAVALGSYNPTHTGNRGPQLIYFNGGTQIEGCPVNFDTAAQSDTVYVCRSDGLRFENVELATPGQGKSLLHMKNSSTLVVSNAFLYNQGLPVAYTVRVTQGSSTVYYVSGGGLSSSFNTTQMWDGVGVQIDSTLMHLAPLSPVASDGLSLQLASPWTGDSGNRIMTIGYGGYFISSPDLSMFRVDALSLQTTGNESSTNVLLGVTSNAALFEVGNNFDGSAVALTTYDNLDGIKMSQGPFQFRIGGDVDTTKNGTQLEYDLNGQGESDLINQKANLLGGLCLYSVVPNGLPAAPYSCITGAGVFNLKNTVNIALSTDTDGIRITPFTNASSNHYIYGTNAENSVVNWSIDMNGFNVGANGSYRFNGTQGLTKTVTLGGCTLAIKGGIVIEASGCD